MNYESQRSAIPAHLGNAGAAFYEDVLSHYQVDDVVGRLMLIQAAEAVDRLTEARELLERDGMLVYDGSGTPRLHPAHRLEKDANQALRTALRQLRLDIEPPRLVGTGEGGSQESALAVKVQLLSDLRELFGGRHAMFTAEILEGLQGKEGSPWGNRHVDPLSAHWLASTLRPFAIRSQKLKIAGRSRRGFRRESFKTVWERYLPKNSE